MPRRTKVQRELHQRVIEEALAAGLPARQVVRSLVREFQLSRRQARYDLRQVYQRWRREDERMRQEKWVSRDLALAAERRERMVFAALEAKDARRAFRAEKDRCRLLGMYPARGQEPPMPRAERDETVQELGAELDEMYAEAPRNPDGSAVLTAYSNTPPPVEDAAYRRAIERPHHQGADAPRSPDRTTRSPGRVSQQRQERIDALRSALVAGVRQDQLEQSARGQFKLTQRQARRDVRLLLAQLEAEGERLRHGTHELQSLTLALRRRERLKEMARAQEDARLAFDLEADRCRLLELYARDRQLAHEARAEEACEFAAERMIEIELARRDRQHGHRHTVAELLPGPDGQPRHPGRQPWTPPQPNGFHSPEP
jgi:hypothetical protein